MHDAYFVVFICVATALITAAKRLQKARNKVFHARRKGKKALTKAKKQRSAAKQRMVKTKVQLKAANASRKRKVATCQFFFLVLLSDLLYSVAFHLPSRNIVRSDYITCSVCR